MEAAGNAGFAIMGGRDQQQLPNPNAVVVTHISTDSAACRHLMYVYTGVVGFVYIYMLTKRKVWGLGMSPHY